MTAAASIIAIGGGIGWKRLVEFVAYCRENAPYYRMLHEDTMGSTIATTSLWGDRLDEYDYTDYGVPLHAPVALDGRWITSIQPHASYGGVSVVTLLYDMLDPERPPPQSITLGKSNELIGCELRVVNPAGGASNMFACGTVLSHLGTTLHIQDTGGAVATAWAAASPETRALAAVYDLREGFTKGVIDSVSTGTWAFGSWPNEPCTYLRVDHGPFEPWMYTLKSEETSRPLWVTLTSGTNPPLEVLVLGVDDPVDPLTSSANFELVVRGDSLPAWVNTGAWYFIDGTRDKMQAAQSGKWRVNATSSGPSTGSGQGSITTFTLDEYAAISEEMQGWMLQPDVNQQVYAPIIGVNELTGTVTVSGNLAGSGTSPWLGAQGTRFRIHAPPGAERTGLHAGTLSLWVGASSSRCLYAGYRYESPLAGFVHSLATGGYIVQHRQTGKNFAGQHYTLHRHYDPSLMRFTSPDPVASPFSNLGAYAGNNPAGAYDPDGLFEIIPETQGESAAVKMFRGMVYFFSTPIETADWAANDGAPEPHLTQSYRNNIATYEARRDLLEAAGDDCTTASIYAGFGTAGDFTGAGGTAEWITGHDSVSGDKLSVEEARERGAAGLAGMTMTAAGGVPGLSVARGVARWSGRMAATGARAGWKATGRAAYALADALQPSGLGGLRYARRGGIFVRPTRPSKMIGGYPEGSFSIINWEGYPAGLPQPKGPFRILRGAEYQQALGAKKAANHALHRELPQLAPFDFHEIHPVKFGGNPVSRSNKVPLLPHQHLPYTKWWAQALRRLGG